jgi:hypothetical protein
MSTISTARVSFLDNSNKLEIGGTVFDEEVKFINAIINN